MESTVAQGIPSASARIVALLLSIELLSKTERCLGPDSVKQSERAGRKL